MSEPTPGRWKVVPFNTRWNIKSDLPGRGDTQQIMVATVVENEAGPAVTVANARLVGAAPELLAVCKEALETLTHRFDDTTDRLVTVGRLANAIYLAEKAELGEE
jgi:hypothetical protein